MNINYAIVDMFANGKTSAQIVASLSKPKRRATLTDAYGKRIASVAAVNKAVIRVAKMIS